MVNQPFGACESCHGEAVRIPIRVASLRLCGADQIVEGLMPL
jgi:hypothetical protein